MLPSAATPSRSRSAPVVGRLLGIVAVVTVVPIGSIGVVPCGGIRVVPCGGIRVVPCGGVPGPGGVQLPWQDGGVQLPWQDGGVQLPWQDGGVQLPWQDGGVGGLINEPPWQPEFAKPRTASETPQTFTGALTGTEIVLPEPVETLPLPVTLPLSVVVPPATLVLAPPTQPEFAKPRSASETPQTFTGALTGAEIVLPEPVETLPLPVTLPLPGPDVPDDSVTRVWAPPTQWEFAKPASATETPQMFTGVLTGTE